jgi:hypothetical protein
MAFFTNIIRRSQTGRGGIKKTMELLDFLHRLHRRLNRHHRFHHVRNYLIIIVGDLIILNAFSISTTRVVYAAVANGKSST